jgi:hypothetical protein
MKKEEIMEAKKLTAPKFKSLQFNHILITTDYEGKNSNIILTSDTTTKALKEIQTVVAVGPHVQNEDIVPGAKVYLDVDRLSAPAGSSGKITHLRNIAFNKYTGEVVTADNTLLNPEKDREYYILLTDREILMVL